MQINPNLINLSHLGLLKITGENAKKFLQGQLTCNLDEITPTQTRLGAHCNPQGRIISLFRLFLLEESYYLQMPAQLIPIALHALKKYAVFFKVELSNASSTMSCLGYIGDKFENIFLEKEDQLLETDTTLIIKIPGTVSRYLIFYKKPIATDIFAKSNVWKQIDITSLIPAIYPETSEKFLPHDINLPGLNGVSFSKGCYTGQEIIARMQYKGKLKNQLYRAKITSITPPEIGANIYHGTEIRSTVVDYCEIDYNQYELLIIASEKDAVTSLSLQPEATEKLELIR